MKKQKRNNPIKKQIREKECVVPTKGGVTTLSQDTVVSAYNFHMPINVTSMVHQFIRMHEISSEVFEEYKVYGSNERMAKQVKSGKIEIGRLDPLCSVQGILRDENLFQEYKHTKSYGAYCEGTLGKTHRVDIFYIDSSTPQDADVMEYEPREMLIVEKEEDVNKCAKALFEAKTVSGSMVNDSQQVHQRPIANFCNHSFIVEDTKRPVTQWHSITPPNFGRPYDHFIYDNFIRKH